MSIKELTLFGDEYESDEFQIIEEDDNRIAISLETHCGWDYAGTTLSESDGKRLRDFLIEKYPL